MSALADYFGAAYLINLADRTDRLKSAKNELARVEWGIGPDDIELFVAQKFLDRKGFPNAGARGAFHSHLECLRRAYAKGRRGALILEDDIRFSSSLGLLTQAICTNLEISSWDFVFFGHYQTGEIPNAGPLTTPDELKFNKWTEEICGLHFYGVSQRILARLINHLERVSTGEEGDQEYGPMPVDGAINVFRRLNADVQTVIVCPKLGWQRPSRSDIMPWKLEQIRALRPLTGALHNLKGVMARWRS
jgi:glycosyl transferase, family 25